MMFDRKIYNLLGIPFDIIDMNDTVDEIIKTIANDQKMFLSTPNLNFLIASQHNKTFRNSVINSDLSIADGMPIVFLFKFLGVPIKERVSGSGLIETLQNNEKCKKRPIKIFFFGGMDKVAEIAHNKINSSECGLKSVGYLNPGFGSVDEMSTDKIINEINAQKPEFIIVSLGAAKGQEWIEKNRSKLNANVISHLGAVVNFIAGTVRRAPQWVQQCHLEWVWRIKEEPALFMRYLKDGLSLIHLFFTSIIPYKFWLMKNRPNKIASNSIMVEKTKEIIILSGQFVELNTNKLDKIFHNTNFNNSCVKLDMTKTDYIDMHFLGLLSLFKKQLDQKSQTIKIVGLSTELKKVFIWNKLDHLLQ